MMKSIFGTSVIAAAIAFASTANAQGPFGNEFNNYQCYKVQEWGGDIKPRRVKVEDQFGAHGQYVADPVLMCNPVSIDGEKVPAPKVHLTCFRTDPNNDKEMKPQTVLVENRFGQQKLALERVSQLICVTSTKEHLK